MKYVRSIIILTGITLLTSCSILRGAKLLAPETFGLEHIEDNIYIEQGADESTKRRLIEYVEIAEEKIQNAYGETKSEPKIHLCITEQCYKDFGGFGSKAKVYGKRILISPRGFTWQFIAHEWSHAELFDRLSLDALSHLPQWFNEGLAVAISEAPEHSEEHWQFLIVNDIDRPTRDELMTYESLDEWIDAVHRFGATKNQERIRAGLPRIAPLYTAAGHEVRSWLNSSTTERIETMIRRLNDGEDFKIVYAQ